MRSCFSLLLLLLAACSPAAISPSAETGTLTVMAAASLSGALTEIGALFQRRNPGVSVQFNFAGSQQLTQQLGQGAPADVFASANQKQMDAAIQFERVEAGSSKIFARNRLVAITPQSGPSRLQSLADLAAPGRKLVFAAREVPAGQYTLAFLDKAALDPAYGPAFREGVLANIVSYEDNVRAVLTKVALGEADGGIVYTSDLYGAEGVAQIEIPETLDVIAEYPVATVKDGKNPHLAQAFVVLLLSDEGQAVLEKYGFLRVRE